jgi:D-alanine-D-alanine ligase
MSIKADPDWWKTMFDDVYLLTDARSVCDEDITRREVDLICELLPDPSRA